MGNGDFIIIAADIDLGLKESEFVPFLEFKPTLSPRFLV